MKKVKQIRNMQRRRRKIPPAFSKSNVESFDSSGSQTRYFVHGPTGFHSQQEPDGTWLFPVQDGLGSIRGVTDEAHSILESREYDPFGNLTDTRGIAQTPFGFTGEMTDPNGLVHLRSRYYNPSLGVFPNVDPVEGTPDIPMSLNQYSYAQGNPVNLTDASGMTPNIVNALRSIPVTNPMGLLRLVNTFNSGCYGSSPRQQIGWDCSCYDFEYLNTLCQQGKIPTCRGGCNIDTTNRIATNCSYDTDQAVSYARLFAQDQFSVAAQRSIGAGTDCANFASQVLYSGGFPLTQFWCYRQTTPPYIDLDLNHNWAVAYNLYQYLTNNEGDIQPPPYVTDMNRAGIGDLVFYNVDNSALTHVAVITGVCESATGNGSVPCVIEHGTSRDTGALPFVGTEHPFDDYPNWEQAQFVAIPRSFSVQNLLVGFACGSTP